MYSWTSLTALIVLVIALSNGHPVPDDLITSSSTTSSETSAISPLGVANTLSAQTKSLVATKTGLLQGLTGGQIQADASTNAEAVQRNERAPQTGFGGYATGGYGGGAAAETPNNFVNVFSQAAANTVNFGTQLLNSLVGVAANILQGLVKLYVDTFSTLANTGAMVISKAAEIGGRILATSGKALQISVGASTRGLQSSVQAATSFGSTLARTFGDTFGGLFQRISQAGTAGGDAGGATAGRLSGGGLAGLGGSGGGLSSLLGALTSLSGSLTGGARDSSGGSGGGNLLGGLGNFAQTLINAKLNLLNGILAPFTGGRPLLNFGRLGSGSSTSSLSSGSSSSGYANAAAASEPSFRISIAGTSPSSVGTSSSASSTDSETNPRVARFYANPDVLAPTKVNAELSDANIRATFKNGVIKGLVDTLNSNLNRLSSLNPTASKNGDLVGSFDNSASFATVAAADSAAKKEAEQQMKNSFSQILPLTFAHQIGQLSQQQSATVLRPQKSSTQRQTKSNIIRNKTH